VSGFPEVGTVRGERVYQVDMGNGFQLFRRAVDWQEIVDASTPPTKASAPSRR
jgi:hypothetical protein